MHRRSLIAAPLLLLASRALAQGEGGPAGPDTGSPIPAPASPAPAVDRAAALAPILDRAAGLEPLRTVLVAKDGERLVARGYSGGRVDRPTNIKSASKSLVSALVGIAIDKGVLEGPDQTVAPLLRADLPANPDPRMAEITIGNLLSMQAGLERTSGATYGRWIASPNWVRAALNRPFVDAPGGAMLYSTGSTHLLSAILTRASGRPTLALAREWLGPIEGFAIASWARDPQGIYFGGNEMAMTPASLLAFAECCRKGGRNRAGLPVIPARWLEESWRVRTQSRFTGDGYGYGWFTREMAGAPVHYGWGYGGQMLYVAPERGVSLVMTSTVDAPSGRTGHRDDLHALAAAILLALG
ncbi:CubicO group peptidase (beta-lactamase class C family) [Angulomicrobium tetraedrale]|uniref:CubicO group peptidase (Beta-lactamase class C family) n=1 Tax=Ancylobacter tetraedralis TaxID=217068 RepID=A0A839ZH64_9HYPH|nr:serine hydrolase [Ancylobacter tetraedralis]MBB3773885.1 CubicO group peptidase (beta-lactamase class C family) [Ancylobacter tetraedralis]